MVVQFHLADTARLAVPFSFVLQIEQTGLQCDCLKKSSGGDLPCTLSDPQIGPACRSPLEISAAGSWFHLAPWSNRGSLLLASELPCFLEWRF